MIPSQMSESASPAPELTLVVPAYRESANLPALVAAVERHIGGLGVSFELLVVDDGSPDDSFEVLARLAADRPWLRSLGLSRNFGKEAALQAGLKEARGRAVVTLDADLQHPLEVIPQMLDAWRGGAQIVNATKRDRTVHGRAYALGANLVTPLLSRLTGIPLQEASDYKLLDREVVDILVRELPERGRFFRGLAWWVGFDQVEIPFSVPQGTRTERRWTFKGLLNLAVTALVSFTSLPMQFVTLLGVVTLILSAALGGEALVSWLRGESVSGFLTIVLTLLILGSFIMISLGIIGIYIAKIYEEVKCRPLYLVRRRSDGARPRGESVTAGDALPPGNDK